MSDYTRSKQAQAYESFDIVALYQEQNSREQHRLSIATTARNIIMIKAGVAFGKFPKAGQRGIGEVPEVPGRHSLSNNDYLAHVDLKADSSRSVRGSNGMSKHERSMINEGCSIYDNEEGGKQMFVTVTLPCSTRDGLEVCAVHWYGMIKALTQRIRVAIQEFYAERAIDSPYFRYIGVPELQKRGALHEHIVIPFEDEGVLELVREHLQGWWYRILTTYSLKTGVDLFKRDKGDTWKNKPRFLRVECERVRFSVGTYMAKYLSKSFPAGEHSTIAKPRSWMIMDEVTRVQVLAARNTETRISDDYENIEADMENMVVISDEYAEVIRPSYHPFTGQLIGWMIVPKEGCKAVLWEHLSALLKTRKGEETLFQLRQLTRPPHDKDGIKSAA